MYIFYIDDSKDNKGLFTFSAVGVPVSKWKATFEQIKVFRKNLKEQYGIYIRKELHAWEFVSGRGRISDQIVTKYERSEIFKNALRFLAQLEGVILFNVVLNREDWAFERLLNRINRTMKAWDGWAILICDEGKEYEYTKLVRKMGVFNPIPSKFGNWTDGKVTRNIPIDRIVEDPIFKKSYRSYFIQLADFCAYALLRKERPLPSKTKYGIDKAFDLLEPICVKKANPRDPFGIIRK